WTSDPQPTGVPAMIYRVYMLAFCDGDVREVDIPDAELPAAGAPGADHATLDLIFKYGQNDFQPRPLPSVSVGDVVELPDGRLYVVKPFGFQLMTPAALDGYRALPRRDRAFTPCFLDSRQPRKGAAFDSPIV